MKKIFNKVFITGGAGFIGSHVSEAFLKNFQIVNWSYWINLPMLEIRISFHQS